MQLVLKRVAATVPTALLVLLIAMLLLELSPTDPAALLAGDNPTPESIERIRERYNLDRPIFVQYATYVLNVLQGDSGTSLRTGQDVLVMILQAFPITAALAASALLLSVLLAFPAGVTAAIYRDRLPDRILTYVTSVLIAVPPFVVGLVLVVVLAIDRSWLPAIGHQPISAGFLEFARHLVLPSIALALPVASELARQVRGSFVDTLQEDFIRSQYAKGLSNWRVIGKHAAKTAMIPVATVLGTTAGRLLGGAVVVEFVFALPGFGRLAATAVLNRDLPLIQGVVVASAAIILLANLLVDLSYLYFSPASRRR